MLRHFFYISIILCVFPACQVTQVSVPDAFDPELKAFENIQSASEEWKPQSDIREPSGFSANRSDTSVSVNQIWVEEMIAAPEDGNKGSQNVNSQGIYLGEKNIYNGPCVLLESERSEGWFANMRFLSRYGMGHALNTIHRKGSEPESVSGVENIPAMHPQDGEPDERQVPASAVLSLILALIPFLSILGIILAIIALVRIDKFPDIYKGSGLATAGLLLSILMSVLYMVMASAGMEAMVGILFWSAF